MNKFMPFATYSQQLSYQDQQALANSVDSCAGSLNAGSLLTAANTVVLDSPSTNSSVSPHSSSSRMYQMLSPGDSVSVGQSHQGSLRNTLLNTMMNNNNSNNKNNVQSSSNLDFDLNYTNSNIASIVAKGSPSSSSRAGSFGGSNSDVLQKLNNISLNLNEKLKSPLLGEIEFFGHDEADEILLGQSKGLNGHDDDDEDELDNFEDDHSTDNSLGKGTPDFQQRMMLNHRPANDTGVFQNSSFKNPNAFNIPTASSNMNAPEMSIKTGGFTLTNKISSKMVPIEPKAQGTDTSRTGSVSSNGQNSGPSSRKHSFQGDINNNKNSISPSTMTG